jgi:hypothetical protein
MSGDATQPFPTMDQLMAAHLRAETKLLDDMESAMTGGQEGPIEALGAGLGTLAQAHLDLREMVHVMLRALHVTADGAQRLGGLVSAFEKKLDAAAYTKSDALRYEGDWDMERGYAPGAVVRSKGALHFALREILPDKTEPQRQGSGWAPFFRRMEHDT